MVLLRLGLRQKCIMYLCLGIQYSAIWLIWGSDFMTIPYTLKNNQYSLLVRVEIMRYFNQITHYYSNNLIM